MLPATRLLLYVLESPDIREQDAALALTLAFPVYAAAYLFPHLFEIDDPQAAMRETLDGR